MGLKDKYIQRSKDSWNRKKTWHPLIISLVLVISLAIIHKAYWVSNTETNPDEIWGNKQITKNGNNWTIDFEEEVSRLSKKLEKIGINTHFLCEFEGL